MTPVPQELSTRPVIIPPRLKFTLPLFGMAAATVLFFWRVLFGNQVLFWADLTMQFYPWRRFAAQCFAGNQIPLWNPYVLCGSPFLANLQSAVFYPVNVLLLGAPLDRGLAYGAALHVFLAGAFTFAYLRHLRLGRFAGVIGALSYMFSAFVICRLTFPSMASVAVWLPLCLLLADRLMRRPNVFDAAGLSACLAAQCLGGHLQLSVMLVLAVVALVGARALQRGPAARVRGSAWVCACLAVGVFVAMGQLLPTADFVRHSQRASTQFSEAAVYSLPPWQLTMLLVPDSYGHPALGNYWGEGNYWELCPYFGALGLAFALTGLLTVRRPARAFFGVLFVGSLVLCFGKYTPLYKWFVYSFVPGFKSFKGPARFLFLTAFSGSVLAALGAQEILGGLRRPGPERAGVGWPVVALALAAAAWLGFWLLAQGWLCRVGADLLAIQFRRVASTVEAAKLPALAQVAHATVLNSLLMSTVFLGASATVLRLGIRSKLRPATVGWAYAALVFVDLWTFGMRANPTTDRGYYRTVPPVLARLPAGPAAPRLLQRPSVFAESWGKYTSFMRFGDTRYGHVRGLVATLTPNLNMWFDRPSAEGYDPIEYSFYDHYMGEAQDRLSADGRTAMLAVINVHFTEMYGSEPQPAGLTLLSTGPPKLYALRRPLPRAYVLPDAEKWVHHGREVAAEAVRVADRTGEARIARYDANAVELSCVSSRPAMVVLADTFAPGWRAFVEGRPARVERVFSVVRGVRVSAGKHRVRFVYLPTGYRLGAFVTLLGLAALAGLVGFGLRQLGPFGRDAAAPDRVQ